MRVSGREIALQQRRQLCTVNGHRHHKFKGTKTNCLPCSLRAQCLRYPAKSAIRQVAIFYKNQPSPMKATELMKRAIDSPRGRALYSQRIGTVEPVFGNLRHNKRLDRFTLRGRSKVNTQWHLCCLVHNIEKIADAGRGAWDEEDRRARAPRRRSRPS